MDMHHGLLGGGPLRLIGFGQQALGFFVGRFVVVRRAVAVGVVLGFLGVAAGFGAFAGVEGEAGQEVVDLGLVEAVLAAVGDGAVPVGSLPFSQGFLGGLAVLVQARQGQQDGGFELDQVDALANGSSGGRKLGKRGEAP